MIKKTIHTLLFCIAFMAPYTAAQTASAPEKQPTTSLATRLRATLKRTKNELVSFAKGANDSAHWHTTMEMVKQSNPELYDRIKTETPLFFDWATHTRWQRRWKNLLRVVGPTTIAGLLFGVVHALSLLKMHPQAFSEHGPFAPFGDTRMPATAKTAIMPFIHAFFGLYWGVIGFIAASYFSQDAPLYAKDTLKPILAILAATGAGDLTGMAISHNATAKDLGFEYVGEYKEILAAHEGLEKDVVSFDVRHFGSFAGGVIGLIGTIIFLRKKMLARHQELKKQEALVTQWLTAAGITINQGT